MTHSTPVQRLQWTTTFFEVGSNVLPPAIITSSALLGSVAYLVPRNAISSVLGLKQRYIYAYAAALMLACVPCRSNAVLLTF